MGLMDDFANPRVQAHACAAVVNFAGERLSLHAFDAADCGLCMLRLRLRAQAHGCAAAVCCGAATDSARLLCMLREVRAMLCC